MEAELLELDASPDYASQIVEGFQKNQWKFVLAESCSGGAAAAKIVSVPGASNPFCGSQVVYRVQTKWSWLGLDEKITQKNDAVNPEVAAALAEKVLAATPEASLAASITGHLGPGAPAHLDGLCFLGLAIRPEALKGHASGARVFELRLPNQPTGRSERQHFASQALLQVVASVLP